MGTKESKHSTPPRLRGLEVTAGLKTVEQNEQAKKRNTYVTYLNQNPLKSGGSEVTIMNETVDDKRECKEDLDNDPFNATADPADSSITDLDNDPLNATADLADSSITDFKLQSEPDYQNLPYQDRSRDDAQFQEADGQIAKLGEDGTEKSTLYENLIYRREKVDMPTKKKSGRPEWEAAKLSIQQHYRELKRRIVIESFCDHCIQNGVLMERDWENINRVSYARHERVDLLLQILLRKRSLKFFAAFCSALRGTGVNDLADKLENTRGVLSEKPYIRDWSSNNIMKVWSGIADVLSEELQPEYILDFFMQENIFSVDEYEEIFCSKGRRREMTKTLLETMKKHLPEAMFVLLYALKEIDEENTDIVERLEKLVVTGNEGEDDSKDCGEKQSTTVVQLVTVHEPAFVNSAPSSTKPGYSVEMSVKKDGYVLKKVEVAIDKYMQNAGDEGLLEKLLSLTGCELTGSELGCVIVHLRPHSKHAFEKLSTFCKNGEIVNFVLNLLREKDICSSLSGGEICINIQLKYNEGELKPKDAEEIEIEIEPDLINMIKDNWSFLCEELDVINLISKFIKKTVFTDQETTELEGRVAKDRHEAADYFLKLLLKKGPGAIQCLMNALQETKNERIIKRLQRSGPVYRNPDAVKENLLIHFESIIQEIDPSQFKDTFVDRNILDTKFFTDFRAKHPRRRCRAALFLKEVLNKGNRAIYALIDVMTAMDCDVLLANLVPTEEALNVPKQETKEAAHINEDAMMKTYNACSPENLIWSCCLKVHVDLKGKDILPFQKSHFSLKQIIVRVHLKGDETKYQISEGSIDKEESLYENVQLDEGIGRAEDESYKPLRYKEDLDQTTRYSITRSECNLSYNPQSEFNKCLTYPITRESPKKNLRPLITSVADSGIDVSVPTNETFSAIRNIHSKF